MRQGTSSSFFSRRSPLLGAGSRYVNTREDDDIEMGYGGEEEEDDRLYFTADTGEGIWNKFQDKVRRKAQEIRRKRWRTKDEIKEDKEKRKEEVEEARLKREREDQFLSTAWTNESLRIYEKKAKKPGESGMDSLESLVDEFPNTSEFIGTCFLTIGYLFGLLVIFIGSIYLLQLLVFEENVFELLETSLYALIWPPSDCTGGTTRCAASTPADGGMNTGNWEEPIFVQ